MACLLRRSPARGRGKTDQSGMHELICDITLSILPVLFVWMPGLLADVFGQPRSRPTLSPGSA
jgi:hypothetical protein